MLSRWKAVGANQMVQAGSDGNGGAEFRHDIAPHAVRQWKCRAYHNGKDCDLFAMEQVPRKEEQVNTEDRDQQRVGVEGRGCTRPKQEVERNGQDLDHRRVAFGRLGAVPQERRQSPFLNRLKQLYAVSEINSVIVHPRRRNVDADPQYIGGANYYDQDAQREPVSKYRPRYSLLFP